MNLKVIFIFLTISIGLNFSLNFEPLDTKTGLTFIKRSMARISYDTYTILYYIDITQYKNITKIVETFLNQTNVECNSLGSHTCRAMLDQAEVLLNHMKRDEMEIEAYQQKLTNRKKRAIEFIGDFYHWAFGLMNADSAREYDQKIEGLQNDSNRFHNLLQEQTILIKESLTLNNKTMGILENHIQKTAKQIKRYIDEQFHRLNWLQAEVVLTEGTDLIKMLETEHHRLTLQILKCLEDTIFGKITQLIPKNKLQDDLLVISKFLKDEQKLPIDLMTENPLHIFKYSKITSILFGNRIMLELNIPIIERGVYTAYEIIPIPTRIGNETVIIKPSTRFTLLNDGAKEFIPITPREFFKSKFNLHGERIIKPADNAIVDYSQNCEISIFMHPRASTLNKFCDVKIIPTANYFVSINSNDAYYLRIVK